MRIAPDASIKLNQRISALAAKGVANSIIAKKLGVSGATIRRRVKKMNDACLVGQGPGVDEISEADQRARGKKSCKAHFKDLARQGWRFADDATPSRSIPYREGTIPDRAPSFAAEEPLPTWIKRKVHQTPRGLRHVLVTLPRLGCLAA